MASSPDWGKPKPRLLKKRNFHTEAATPHPKQWDRKKWTVKKWGSLASRPTGPKLEPPTFPVLQHSQTPSLPRKTGKNFLKSLCHPLTCPSGKSGKIHLCKQKQKGAAKFPSLSTGHTEIWDKPKCQRTVQRKGRCTCRKECRAVQKGCLQQEKDIICTEERWRLSPTLGR